MNYEREKGPLFCSVPLKESPRNQQVSHLDSDLAIHVKYLNYSGEYITLGLRSGVVFDIPPRGNRTSKSFIIREELWISDRLKNSVRDRLLQNRGIVSEELEAFSTLFMNCYRDQHHALTMRFDYEVEPTFIAENGGSIYLIEKDIILSGGQDNIPLHPFCLEAMSRPLNNANSDGGAGAHIRIVDNKGTIGPRYVRMFDKVVRIQAVPSPLQPDGLYISHRNLVEESNGDLNNFIDFVPPDKMKTLPWLFVTYGEAKSSPEVEATMNLELKQLEIDSKKISATTTVTKSEMDLEKIVLERENSSLQRQLNESERLTKHFENEMQRRYAREEHDSKISQLRNKDYYEDRSVVRKDSSEWVKVIPALLMGAGAAVIAIKGLLSN